MLNGFDVILPPRLYAIFVGVQWRTWRRVLRLDLLSEFLQMPFDDWLRSNIARSTAHEPSPSQWWSHPTPGWVKGNIDASVHTVTGQATIGGLLRDEHWDWVVGFTRPVGRCSVLVVELWALHDMLHCPWSEGFQRVISETDCLEVVRILQRVSPSLSGTGLVASIFRLTGYVWDLVIRHVPRDCNVFADRLSAWGRLHPQEVVTLDQPPLSLHA
ncbi:hypothetical protein V6N11_079173 [Hibiscus sabdariffa]|uniref:RNase H type-1 domain-containing protein n=1 Tax=Hibiscus sabdariffa TaxID=183260 RepID=A0ABR2RUU5_9ROSI